MKIEREMKRRNTERRVNKERVQIVERQKTFNNFSVLQYENAAKKSKITPIKLEHVGNSFHLN
jgi:hypothetical protein